MTREDLCEVCQAAVDTPAGDLVAAWERRRAELADALAGSALAKPVRLRLRRELGRLEDGAELAKQLGAAAQVDRYLAEAEAQWGRPTAARAAIRLCIDRARSLARSLPEDDVRFGCELRIESAAERLASPSVSARPGAGAVLELVPLAAPDRPAAEPALRFVARPTFTLGRRSGADFVTRFLPDTDENRQRTHTISRLNATLFVRDGRVWLEDGGEGPDGARRPSLNGTRLDERPIREPVPLDLTRERRIKLGQFGYELSVRALAPGPAGPGCVTFLPIAGPAPSILPVWLLSEAALPDSSARLRFQEGGYWLDLQNVRETVVRLDGQSCPPESPLPLQSEHRLTLGHNEYLIRICV